MFEGHYGCGAKKDGRALSLSPTHSNGHPPDAPNFLGGKNDILYQLLLGILGRKYASLLDIQIRKSNGPKYLPLYHLDLGVFIFPRQISNDQMKSLIFHSRALDGSLEKGSLGRCPVGLWQPLKT